LISKDLRIGAPAPAVNWQLATVHWQLLFKELSGLRTGRGQGDTQQPLSSQTSHTPPPRMSASAQVTPPCDEADAAAPGLADTGNFDDWCW